MSLTFEEKSLLWTAFRSSFIQLEENDNWWHIHGVDTTLGIITTKGAIGHDVKKSEEAHVDVRTLKRREVKFLGYVPVTLDSVPSGLEYILSELRIATGQTPTAERPTVTIVRRARDVLLGSTDGTFVQVVDWLTGLGFTRSEAIYVLETINTMTVWIDLKDCGGVTGPGTSMMMRMMRDRLIHVINIFDERLQNLKIERKGNHDNF